METKAIFVQFPLNRSIRSKHEAFTQVFPQLVFENDLIDFEKLGEISIVECGAHIAFEAIAWYILFNNL